MIKKNTMGRLASLLCALMLGVAGGAYACGPGESGATCGVSAAEPASKSASSVGVGAGNPINVITGNKYQRETDMPALPGVLGLEIVRHYNSTLSGANTRPGIIGRGWKLSYETVLYAFDNSLQIMQADGTRLIFSRDLLNPSLCASADPANGQVTITGTRGHEVFVWRWNDGRLLTFDQRGNLTSVQAPTGEILTLLYDQQGLLVKVTDPQGRSLRLAYLDRTANASRDQFRGVQSITTPVGRFRYEYGNALPPGASAGKLAVAANLARVHYPDAGPGGGSTGRSYHFEDARRPTYLTGISIHGVAADGKAESHRYATYGYDINGKAVLSTHEKDVDKVTLDYSKPGQTLLTNSMGQRTTYKHAILAGAFRLLEVRGAGCSLCGDTDIRYAYDRIGHLVEATRLDGQGRPVESVRNELDRYGRILRSARVVYAHGKPQAPEWRVRYEYGDTLANLPALIATPSVVPGRESQIQIRYNAYGQPLRVTQNGWSPPPPGQDGPAARLERSISYAYRMVNGRSLLVSIDGPLPNGGKGTPADSDITRITWDVQGNAIKSVQWPGYAASTLEHDDAGRVRRIIDETGHATEFSVDARGRTVATTANGVTESSIYDAMDRPFETGYRKGGKYTAYVRMVYDDESHKSWRATSLGMLEWRQFDTEGRLRAEGRQSSSMATVNRVEYDERGHVARAADDAGRGQSYQWNTLGLPDKTFDALGRERAYRYDDAGRLNLVLDSAGATRLGHDARGHITAVTAPNGAVTRYVHDDFGRITAIDSPDSGLATRRHDAADQVVGSSDALGNQGRYAYDAAGRVIEQVLQTAKTDAMAASTSITRWRYAGRLLVALEHPEQSERYEYDAQRRLVLKSTTVRREDGGELHSVTRYRRDADGQLLAIVLPDGSALEYRRNGQNQVVAIVRERIGTPWLRWLAPGQVLVRDIERSMAGLKRHTFGNGVQAVYQRDRQGTLAGIAYQAPDGQRKVLDHAYLWDRAGNLLRHTGTGGATSYAYDVQDRLIIAASANAAGSAGTATGGGGAGAAQVRHARYFYDGAGNRLLSQEDAANPADLFSNTLRGDFGPASNRWLGTHGEAPIQYDLAGQPRAMADLRYQWDAQGRLRQVARRGKVLASYRYNADGERVAKHTQGIQSYYLYEGGKLSAELDGQGRITRQYVYLGDLPAAVIDAGNVAAPAADAASALGLAWRDLGVIARGWWSAADRIAYVHTNHLGAPEAVTDARGDTIWHASYSQFGALQKEAGLVRTGMPVARAFEFNLRLPGQYEDTETGLYYNHFRYYDPRNGRYLSPDPLGLGGGINPYAYVSNNPLRYIDPDGLVLFAFDGTGNDRSDQRTLSNVVRFHENYVGEKYYITGPATRDPDTGIEYWSSALDTAYSKTGKERITAMFTYLNKSADKADDETALDIDVTGFSRGASQARDFANQIAAQTKDGYYQYKSADGASHCQKVNFRFMGIFDTVLSTHTGTYQLGIPDAFKYVAHAVALNEYRGALVAFPSESILGAPVPDGATRIERGFLGAHSDIGGGYPDQELAKVALDWMFSQAKSAGVEMKPGADTIAASAVMHDASTNLLNGAESGGPTASSEDREVRYRDGKVVRQRNATTGVMQYADTVPFITYLSNPVTSNPISATVDTKAYIDWLNAHGYGIQLKVN